MSEQRLPIPLEVNGVIETVHIEPRMTLLDCLRDQLGLKGAHAGCEHGVCGACTVLFDGEPVRSCLLFGVMAQGHQVTTIEAVGGAAGTALDPIQEAFWDCHALQCGYCTPAMILTARALLDANPDPSEAQVREALSGNLCRCTGYTQIVEAVLLAAARLRPNLTDNTSPTDDTGRTDDPGPAATDEAQP